MEKYKATAKRTMERDIAGLRKEPPHPPERIPGKGEPETEVTAQQADALDRQYRKMWMAIRDHLNSVQMPRPNPVPISAEQEETAARLRERVAHLMEREPDIRLHRVSDEGSMVYTDLARGYVRELTAGNPAVMRDVAHSHKLFARMGDTIIILAGSLLWLMDLCNNDDEETCQEVCRTADRAMINCYAVRQRAPLTRRFSIFYHWFLSGTPERKALMDEWMALLEKTENTILQSGEEGGGRDGNV